MLSIIVGIVASWMQRQVKLSPKETATLEALLDGDSEKQVAARLQLSTATVHQHVTSIYRKFRVHSRAELMAHHQGRWLWVRTDG